MRSRKAYRMNMDNREEIQSTLPSRPAENLPNLPARHWLKAGRCVSRPVPGCLASPISAHAHLRLGSNVHARWRFPASRGLPTRGREQSLCPVESIANLAWSKSLDYLLLNGLTKRENPGELFVCAAVCQRPLSGLKQVLSRLCTRWSGSHQDVLSCVYTLGSGSSRDVLSARSWLRRSVVPRL